MGLRVQRPGQVTTTACGRVYVIAYPRPTTVEIEAEVWADYLRHREAVGGRTLILTRIDHPLLPLPNVEVRAFWRRSMAAGSGVEGFAVVNPGFAGIAAATLTNLLEHMVDPLHGIRFRVFTRAAPAIAWLGEVAPLDCDPDELRASLDRLPGPDANRASA